MLLAAKKRAATTAPAPHLARQLGEERHAALVAGAGCVRCCGTAVAPIAEDKVVAQRVDHDPHHAVKRRRRWGSAGGGIDGPAGSLWQVHPSEQEAVDEEGQGAEVEQSKEQLPPGRAPPGRGLRHRSRGAPQTG